MYVMDGGAGDEAVATVVAALQREDWPTIRTTRRREGPTNSYAFVMKHAENPRSMVEVLFRNDEAQAERYAYRLHRDLVLDGVEVRAWADAPAPFVVVVGGSVARR
ncbi:MAG: hypothetical protein H6737_14825 [Alphaproteobacteria bacterium]|nr:hypothetical protein [Alphaproteobacteria bacterium]